MTSNLLADLDDGLAEYGQNVTLRRTAAQAADNANHDVVVRARVDTIDIVQLASGVFEQTVHVIISPTQIIAAGWPGDGSEPSATIEDPTQPMNGDVLLINGRSFVVGMVDPKVVGDVLVRIEMRAVG